MGLFKRKATKEKLAAKKVNCVGERTDKLDAEGNLPFGWVFHNQKYVKMIEKDLKPYRKAILDAKTDAEKYAALKSFVSFLDKGEKRYNKINKCVGKYFEEHIRGSVEAKQRLAELKAIEKKLKKK